MIQESTPGGVYTIIQLILPITCAQHSRDNYPVLHVAIDSVCVGGWGGGYKPSGLSHNMIKLGKQMADLNVIICMLTHRNHLHCMVAEFSPNHLLILSLLPSTLSSLLSLNSDESSYRK